MLKKTFLFCLLYSAFFVGVSAQKLDTVRSQLREVEIKTKFNPAIPIIKNAIKNRNENGQFSNRNFSQTTYQRMVFTGDWEADTNFINKVAQLAETLETDTLSRSDSSYLKTKEFFENNHLFFMETVTQNYFKRPATTYEKVIAHRTAGMKDPIASIFLAKQQAVNFYQSDFVMIFETSYVNPISSGAINIYDFRLEKRIIQENDTTFLISFKPQKNAHFKSLAGKIWITKDNYAITKIEAAPFDKKLEFAFNITQKFEKQSNNTYFLTNMLLKLVFENVGLGIHSVFFRPLFLLEKNISNIDYETRLRNRDFGLVDIDEDVGSASEQEKILDTYRPTALTKKEANTLMMIDSIMGDEKWNMDKVLGLMKILVMGKIPVRWVSFDLNQIFTFNSLETARLGLGVYTNDRLSKVVSFGGFFGYGFKDKTWKWGSTVEFNGLRNRDFKITMNYYSTLIESGRTVFFDRDYSMFSGEFYRTWLFKHFYRSNALGVTVHSKLKRWLTGYVSSYYSANKTIFDYSFQQPFENKTPQPYSFDDFFVKVGTRIAFRESFWGADKFYFHSVSPFPVLILQYTRGFKGVIISDFNYNRVDLKMMYRKNWKILGFTNLTLFAGFIDRPLPSPLLFNQRAGYYPIGFYGGDQFGAMRPDEFLSDKYASLFVRHNFGRMTQNKRFSPRIIVCQGIGFGGVRSPNSHHGIIFKTMEKGYFESGVMIDDLLVIGGVLSFGVGTFVRYGAYYLPKPQYKTIDNFAFKISFRVPFDR
jgi:hypothetical protein